VFAIGRSPSRIGNGKETECSQQIVFDKALCLHVPRVDGSYMSDLQKIREWGRYVEWFCNAVVFDECSVSRSNGATCSGNEARVTVNVLI